ncbi:hypothetical protein ENUP19_0283G0011 [Entamoeba nuttalli]
MSIRTRSLFDGGKTSPISSLLEINSTKILLDCGVDCNFTREIIEKYDSISDIDIVLISHSDLRHMGALPYIANKNPNCSIYTTDPVGKMGYLCMKEAIKTQQLIGYPCYRLKDVEQTYKRIFLLEYYKLQKCGEVEVSAHPSGRTLGGTNWKICNGCDEIIYAVGNDLNNGFVIEGSKIMKFNRPMVLLTDIGGLGKCQEMLNNVMMEIRKIVLRKGCCLLPVECGGRIMEYMEMVYISCDVDINRVIKDASFYCISSVADQIKEMNKTIMEWVRDGTDITNFKNISFQDNLEKLKRDLDARKPCVVFATLASFSVGSISRDVLLKICRDKRNGIIFLEPPQKGTVASEIEEFANPMNQKTSVKVDVWHTEDYTEEELKEIEALKEQKAKEENENKEHQIEEEKVQEKEIEEIEEIEEESEEDKKTMWQIKTDLYEDDLEDVGGLFPFFHNKVETTVYGDISTFKIEMSVEEPLLGNKDVDEVNEIEDYPRKYVKEEEELIISCTVASYDVSAEMETTKIRSIIARLIPRNLVFVSALEPNGIEWFKQNLPHSNIYGFNNTEIMTTVCPVTPSETFTIDDSLLTVMKLNHFKEFNLGPIDAKVEDGTLLPITRQQRKRHESVYIGELPIKVLTKAIETENIDVKIVNGTIVCANGTITVSKEPSDVPKFIVRGRMNKAFFKVRKIVAEQFCIL